MPPRARRLPPPRLLVVAALLAAATACCPVPLADGEGGTRPAARTGVIGTVLAHDDGVTWLRIDGGGRLAVRPRVAFEVGTSLYVVGTLDDDGTLQVGTAQPLATAGADDAATD